MVCGDISAIDTAIVARWNSKFSSGLLVFDRALLLSEARTKIYFGESGDLVEEFVIGRYSLLVGSV